MLTIELLDTANIVDVSTDLSTLFELLDKKRQRRGTMWVWAAHGIA